MNIPSATPWTAQHSRWQWLPTPMMHCRKRSSRLCLRLKLLSQPLNWTTT